MELQMIVMMKYGFLLWMDALNKLIWYIEKGHNIIILKEEPTYVVRRLYCFRSELTS